MLTKTQTPREKLRQRKENKTTSASKEYARRPSMQDLSEKLDFSPETAPEVLTALQNDTRFPGKWVGANRKALETGDYTTLEELFTREKFLGPKGHFVMVAPYKTFRDDREEVCLTGIIGRSLAHRKLGAGVYRQIKALIAPAQDVIPHVLPVFIQHSFGMAAPEIGEAFLVPTSWAWSSGQKGPALNNMTEQARRIDDAGEEALKRIMRPTSFELLMKPFRAKNKGHLIRHLEYSLHDAGHMSGYRGLFYKLSHNLLSNHWTRGFEEYRADAVDLQLAVDLYPAPLAAKIISSNMVTRFAMDAHRAGGVERDFDAVVSLLSFDRLWRSRAIRINCGQIEFVNPTGHGLIQATEWQRRDGILLSRAELRLSDERDLPSLYHEFCQLAGESKELFEKYVVKPCRGLYSRLR
jgi:hypothetical protein